MRAPSANRTEPSGKYARVAISFLIVVLSMALLLPGAASAATAPTLGVAASFAILGGSAVTNTGPSVINGDLGVYPGSAITGFPPGILTGGGTFHAADAVAQQAQANVTTAYNQLAGQACDTNLTGQNLGGLTLVPGVYCFSVAAQLTGTLTLDAQGDPAAVFVFQIGSTLTTASNSTVQVINGGSPCNAYWKVGSSATLGTNTRFVGNILALASISLTTGTNVTGRALARNAAVTMDTNSVSFASCAPPVTVTTTPVTTTPVTTTPVTTTPGTTPVTTTPGTTPGTAPPGTQTVVPFPGQTVTTTPAPGTEIPGPSTEVPAPGTAIPGPGTQIPGPGTQIPGPGTATPGTGTMIPGTQTVVPFPGQTVTTTPSGTVTPGTGTALPATRTATPGSGPRNTPTPHPIPEMPNTGSGGDAGSERIAGAAALLLALFLVVVGFGHRRAAR